MFGAGTDFCLFLIARYREMRAEGRLQREGIVESVHRVGHALTASAGTTIAGLLMMVFSQFGKFTYSGPAIAISLVIALLVCLTLAPALLATPIGRRVIAKKTASGSRFWSAIADRVIARPGLILAICLLIAAPLAWYGYDAPVTYDILSELPPDAESARGTELLLEHLPPGEIGPLTVLVRLPKEDFASDDGRRKIANLTYVLFHIPGVDKVRSLYRPTGEQPGKMSVATLRGWSALVAAGSEQAEEAYVSKALGGDVTRLTVVLKDRPFAPEAMATLDRIDAALGKLRDEPNSAWKQAEFAMLGVTSGIRDLQHVTQIDRQRIELLVTAAVFVVILILLRRPLVCLYLIGTVVLNFFVTLGIVYLALKALHGADYPGLDWKAPIFLFVILVAVGQDYNIFLTTRIFEEQERLGPLEGIKRGMVQTGGIITSCGVIMAATFGSMISGSLPEMAEMGGALALGILADTFLVRTILAPAFLALLARWSHSQDMRFDVESREGAARERAAAPT
jgi:RND superfamily putative drug exporter